MTYALLTLLCLITVCLGAREADAKDASFELDAEQSVLLGREVLAAGKPEIALALARALIDRHAQDPDALVLMAAALQHLGNYNEARNVARSAYSASKTDQQAFESAMLVGRSDFHRDAYTRSQWWLRRAAQAAPDTEARRIAERNFKHVRRVNPLRLQFRIGVRSSSNINDGSSTEEIELFGLPFRLLGTSRALSGTELAVDADLRYRIAQSERSETALTTELETRSYRLSSEAQRQAPDASGSDFNFQRVEVGALHRFARAEGNSVYEVAGAVGLTWYGGEKLSDYARLRLSQSFQLRPSTGLRVTLSTQKQWRQDSAARSVFSYGLQGEIRHHLKTGARLIFLGSVRRTEADAAYIQNTALRAQLIYRMAEPIFGVRFSSSVGLEQRRYPADGFQPSGRRDLRGKLGISASFENIEYMGFTPSWHVEFSQTDSNVAFYEQESVDMFLGINSSF
ncbi:surface lipoprotein assembly modifier [Roseovarius tibetensis]|uniref:tetratricopeptide repeat protein n=1 Tax=Roseovarius tibetensis TaxID=2685897 RepID=UPI003D7F841C